MKNTLGAIILGAGKGKRMQIDGVNKVTLPVNKKPMIQYALDVLHAMHMKTIIVVVGHAKESVMNLLQGEEIIFAHQDQQQGTAHAVKKAMEVVPEGIKDVFVLQGDDAMFYTKETLEVLIHAHQSAKTELTFLTITVDNPHGLGRIVRDPKGEIVGIIEEKDATNEQKVIKEINPACYLFSVAFLDKYLEKVEKSSETGEYYLTQLIAIALKENEKVHVVSLSNVSWRGVNTKEELLQAEHMVASSNKL